MPSLNASGFRHQVLFQENPSPMWVYDTATLQFLAVNDAAVREYGYTQEEFLGMRLTDIRPAEDAARLLTFVDSVAEDGDGWRKAGQWRHILRSGALIDVEILSHTLTFRGRPARMAIAHDVTERQRRAEQFREAEERMRFALTSSHLGIWEANLHTGVSYWSDTCEAMHGLEPGTFGQTFAAFLERIHPEDRAAVQRQIDVAVQAHGEVELEYRTVWADGTERRIVTTARFFYDDAGTPIRGAGVAMDVTERRALEMQLRQSQKMEAIGQLAGGIAHDFNNMLTAILGNAELLLEDLPAGAPHHRLADQIRQAGRGAAALTQQLLAFSRKQVLQPRVLHVGDVVGEVMPMLRRLIGETVDLKTIISDAGAVKADASQLQQVLVNLAVNARDAMPDGGRLTIATADVTLDEAAAAQHPGTEPGEYVMLSVIDTGCGIDAATLRQIFEPFFTTKSLGKGTGLGLATVDGIVRQSGGHIAVRSEAGHGTTFTIYLPRTAEIDAVKGAPRIDAAQLRGTETILLVEDEEVVRNFVSHALTQCGYQVHAIATPSQAIAFAESYGEPIHALVTDVVLPEMNGRVLASRIRERHPEATVLYVSGYTDQGIVRHGVLEDGMSYLSKPFTLEALGVRVRDVLRGAPAPAAIRA